MVNLKYIGRPININKKPLSLRKNFVWTFIGNAVFGACRWGMLVVLAKISSAEMIGQLSLGIALTTPIMTFTDLSLRGVMVTDTKETFIFSEYVRLRIITIFIGLLFLITVILLSGYGRETSLVVLFVGFERAAWSLSDIIYGFFQQHGRMDYISISIIYKNILSLCLISFVVYFTGNIIWGTLGLAVGAAVTLITYDLSAAVSMMRFLSKENSDNNKKYAMIQEITHQKWDIKKLKSLIWLALPLGFVMMLNTLNMSIPRYFIERYLGPKELGIFSAIMAPTVAAGPIVSALGQSASRHLAEYFAFGKIRAYRALLLKLLGIGGILGFVGLLVAWIGGQKILTLLYRPEYAAYPEVFIIIMVSVGISFLALFLGFGLTAARYFRIQLPLSACVAATSAMSCIWLIPRQGLMGAALSLVFSNAAYLIGSSLIIGLALRKYSPNRQLIQCLIIMKDL
jgi:O-antigen/teichoic acid export membrane protein